MTDPPERTPSATGAGEPGRSDDAHESLCRRCGVSCHLALPVNDVPVVIQGLRCQFLAAAPQGRWACSVYPERFERAPWCHHADVAVAQGFLAHDCPYALRSLDVDPADDGARSTVRGKVRLPEAQYARLWPAILGELVRVGVPDWVDRPGLLAELSQREGPGWRLLAMPGARLRLVPPEQERA